MGDSRGPCRARPGRVPRQSPRRPAHAEVLLLAPTSNFASLNDRVTLSSSVAWLERPATPRLAVTEGARPRGAPGVLEGLRSSAVSLGSHLRPALVAHFPVDSPVVGAVSPGGGEGVVVPLWLSGESGWGFRQEPPGRPRSAALDAPVHAGSRSGFPADAPGHPGLPPSVRCRMRIDHESRVRAPDHAQPGLALS